MGHRLSTAHRPEWVGGGVSLRTVTSLPPPRRRPGVAPVSQVYKSSRCGEFLPIPRAETETRCHTYSLQIAYKYGITPTYRLHTRQHPRGGRVTIGLRGERLLPIKVIELDERQLRLRQLEVAQDVSMGASRVVLALGPVEDVITLR